MVLLLWKCVHPNLLAELIICFPTPPRDSMSSAQTAETPKTIMWTLHRTAAERAAPAEHVAPSENNIPSEATGLSASPLLSGTEPKQIHINRY